VTQPERAVDDPAGARLPRGLAGAFVLLLCAVVPFIMFAVSYEVAMRHFFGLVTLWLNDVTGYVLLALTFLGGAFVMARDGHTKVDIVVEHTTQGIRERLTVVNAVLVLLVALVLAMASGFTVVDSYRRNLAMVGIVEVPRWVVLTPIFAGSVLLAAERVLHLRALWRGRRAPRQD
jgi:TRAP-type C4-dicarboxylate transport system permease small subunit